MIETKEQYAKTWLELMPVGYSLPAVLAMKETIEALREVAKAAKRFKATDWEFANNMGNPAVALDVWGYVLDGLAALPDWITDG